MPTKHIGIRLEESHYNELQKLGNVRNQTANQIAKIAIIEWLQGQWTRNSGFITIPKENFAFMLNILNKDQLNDYLDKLTDNIVQYFEFYTHKPLRTISLETYLEVMIKFIGTNGMMWFEKIDYESKQDFASFSGNHAMGETWSKIFILVNQLVIKKGVFPFSIKEETILTSPTTVFLEFIC